jgi:hypothetical protein
LKAIRDDHRHRRFLQRLQRPYIRRLCCCKYLPWLEPPLQVRQEEQEEVVVVVVVGMAFFLLLEFKFPELWKSWNIIIVVIIIIIIIITTMTMAMMMMMTMV